MRSKAVPWFQLTNYFLSANLRRWFYRQQLIWLNDGWSLGNSNNYRQIIHIISRSSNNSRSFSVTLSAPHLIAQFGILDQTNQHHFREKEEQLDFIFNLLEILLISSFYLACVNTSPEVVLIYFSHLRIYCYLPSLLFQVHTSHSGVEFIFLSVSHFPHLAFHPQNITWCLPPTRSRSSLRTRTRRSLLRRKDWRRPAVWIIAPWDCLPLN